MSNDINMEGRKFLLDILKHVTTLSTGSILILATFLEKILSQGPMWSILVPISLGSFTVSIAGAVVAMFLMIVLYGFDINGDDRESMRVATVRTSTGCACISFGGFLLGIGSFAVFAMKNFYS